MVYKVLCKQTNRELVDGWEILDQRFLSFAVDVFHSTGSQKCSSVTLFTDWTLQFRSPNYPKYKPNQDICWSVTVSRGNIIEVKPMDFEVSAKGLSLVLNIIVSIVRNCTIDRTKIWNYLDDLGDPCAPLFPYDGPDCSRSCI